MSPAMNQQENRLIDEIISRRRSIRAFKTEAPPDEWIEQIVLAGLQAPYAGLAANRTCLTVSSGLSGRGQS